MYVALAAMTPSSDGDDVVRYSTILLGFGFGVGAGE